MLRKIVEKMGKKLIKRGAVYYCTSPFRNEKTASFCILKTSEGYVNWKDHGSGEGGDLYKFCMIYYGEDFLSAKKRVENMGFEKQNFSFQTVEKKKVEKYKIFDEIDSSLQNYLIERGILKHDLKQIYYEYNGNKYVGLCKKNNSGGYEIFQRNFKRVIGKKDIIYIGGEGTQIVVFEGYIDYLSYKQLYTLRSSVIVLNSVALADSAIEILSGYNKIFLFLDNDNAGRECKIKIMSNVVAYSDTDIEIIDMSDIYNNYKDMNDYLVSTL